MWHDATRQHEKGRFSEELSEMLPDWLNKHAVGCQVQEQDYMSVPRVITITAAMGTKENCGCPIKYKSLVGVATDGAIHSSRDGLLSDSSA